MELKQKKDLPLENPYAAPESNPVPDSTADLEHLVSAPHGRRIVAFIIDIVLVYTVVIAFAALFGAVQNSGLASGLSDGIAAASVIVSVGIPMAYHTLMEGSSLQASVGKLALGLRVVDVKTGERLGWWRAFLRSFIRSWLSLGWMFWLFVLFTNKNQGLWDLLASARVVRK